MKKDISQILINIQQKSGITVERVSDIISLKEEIETITNSKIGYNTLRRLFGFLPSTKPSQSTLNVLAKYLGFYSYSNYVSNKFYSDEWYFHQNLIRLHVHQNHSIESLQFLEKGLGSMDVSIIAQYISTHIYLNNIPFLKTLFSTVNFNKLPDSEILKLSTIITQSLLIIPIKLALKIYQDLIPIDNFRKLIPMFYVDYRNLKGIYSDVLNIIKQSTNCNEDVLFAKLVLSLKSFYFCEKHESCYIVSKPQNFDKLHTILKGRYLGQVILVSTKVDDQFREDLLESLKSHHTSLFTLEITPALIIKEEYDLLTTIYHKFYENIFESHSWAYRTTNAINLIGLANVNWHHKKYSSAKNNLELIEIDKVELGYYEYVSLFYCLTKIKISYSERDKPTNRATYEELLELVKLTGFERFKTQALKYLLI